MIPPCRAAGVKGGERGGQQSREKERLINISVVREWVGAQGDGAEVVAIAPSPGPGPWAGFFFGCCYTAALLLGLVCWDELIAECNR